MRELALTLPGFNSTTTIDSTPGLGSGAFTKTQLSSLGGIVSSGLEVAFYISIFLMFFWLLWGVFKYLTAEGSKEHLLKARNHIRWAFVGFAVIMLAFVVSRYLVKVIPSQQVPLTPLSSKTSDLKPSQSFIDSVKNFVAQIVDPNKNAACNLVNGSCASQEGAVIVSLSDFYSSDIFKREGKVDSDTGELAPNSFAAAKCSGACREPSLRVPFIYHQRDVTVPEYNNKCPVGTADSIPASSCGPTSLAMVAEAFNGRESNKSGGYANETANNLTRLFLSNSLMTCKKGIWSDRIGNYVQAWNTDTTDKTLQVRFSDSSQNPNPLSMDELEGWYDQTGYPVWTNVWYYYTDKDGVEHKVGHYVAVVGISDNYIWVADPAGPSGQNVLRYKKSTFEQRYLKDIFWKITPLDDGK